MLLAMALELAVLVALVISELQVKAPAVQPDQPAGYVQFGMGPRIVDTQTGAVCDPYPGGSQRPRGYPAYKFR